MEQIDHGTVNTFARSMPSAPAALNSSSPQACRTGGGCGPSRWGLMAKCWPWLGRRGRWVASGF